jgi:hypothetical protein
VRQGENEVRLLALHRLVYEGLVVYAKFDGVVVNDKDAFLVYVWHGGPE